MIWGIGFWALVAALWLAVLARHWREQDWPTRTAASAAAALWPLTMLLLAALVATEGWRSFRGGN